MNVRPPDSSCARKRRYSSRRLAKLVALRRESEGAPRLHVYPCDRCDGYHLSRTSPDAHRAAMEGIAA